MAFTEGTQPPTSGTEDPTRFWEQPEDEARWESALKDAFGSNAGGNDPDDDNGDDNANDDASTPSQGDGTDDGADDTSGGANGTGSPSGASAGDEGQGGGEGDDTSGAIGGSETDFATLFRNRMGRDPQPGEIEGYIAVAEWAAGLTAEQQVAIQRAYENPELIIGQQAPGQNQGQQQADDTPDPLVEEFGEDHPLIQRIKQLEAAQAQVNQQVTTTTAEQQQRETLANIQVGVSQFKTRYADLTDIEIEQLQGAVAQSRIFPGFVNAAGGDIAKGMEAAMDHIYWQHPVFRQREIDRQVAAKEAEVREKETRKAKASSVSGTGGNGASRETPPPKTNEGRWAAVTQGLAEAMSNGQREN